MCAQPCWMGCLRGGCCRRRCWRIAGCVLIALLLLTTLASLQGFQGTAVSKGSTEQAKMDAAQESDPCTPPHAPSPPCIRYVHIHVLPLYAPSCSRAHHPPQATERRWCCPSTVQRWARGMRAGEPARPPSTAHRVCSCTCQQPHHARCSCSSRYQVVTQCG